MNDRELDAYNDREHDACSSRMYFDDFVCASERADMLERQLAAKGWHPIGKPPKERGWYGILDAQNEPRAGLYSPVSGGWIHNSVEPLKGWCHFPPIPSTTAALGEERKS